MLKGHSTRETCARIVKRTLTREQTRGMCSYIIEMKSHSISCRNPKDNTEAYTEQQSDDGGIIIPAEIAGDDYSCPDSDIHDHCGYYWTNYTSDDDVMSPARHVFRKFGRHLADDICSVRWSWRLNAPVPTDKRPKPSLRKKMFK